MKTPIHDYYALLGVPKSASLTQIKQSYRKLAIIHHPDRAGDGRQIVLINEAYATLKDPKKRAEYDAYHVVRFGTMAKMTDKFTHIISPVMITRLNQLESHLVHRAKHFAKQYPDIAQHARRLFDKLSTLVHDTPTLVISQDIAKDGGQIYFYHQHRQIRTTLPSGLTDGSQIKLTIDGVGVWFVIKINNI